MICIMQVIRQLILVNVDLEYEWFLKGTGSRCEVQNKYNNELPNGDIAEDIHDENYLSEIIHIIKNVEGEGGIKLSLYFEHIKKAV